MKKFNLFKEITIVNKNELLQAINQSNTFGITIEGEIVSQPFNEDAILIYAGEYSGSKNFIVSTQKFSFEEMFGKNYQVVEDDERVLLKSFSNWQEIIGFNAQRASYDDTTGDGVAEFSNKELEDIGWHATEFNINYRELVEELEAKCEGTLLCIEQEDPYQFSGLGFLSDNPHAKEVLYKFCKNKIKKIMDEDKDYAKENLTKDESEAAEFFGLIPHAA